jgi:hypothetical protein
MRNGTSLNIFIAHGVRNQVRNSGSSARFQGDLIEIIVFDHAT